MTRAQRRIAARKRAAASAGLPLTFERAGVLAENPNRGKRAAARMTPTESDIRRMIDRTREDTPVQVTEHRIGSRGRWSKRPTMQYSAMRSDYR